MSEQTFSFGSQREGPSRYLAALREHWLLILTLVVVSVGLPAESLVVRTDRARAQIESALAPPGAATRRAGA